MLRTLTQPSPRGRGRMAGGSDLTLLLENPVNSAFKPLQRVPYERSANYGGCEQFAQYPANAVEHDQYSRRRGRAVSAQRPRPAHITDGHRGNRDGHSAASESLRLAHEDSGEEPARRCRDYAASYQRR